MIAYLTGTLLAKEGDEAIVVCGGVGYSVRLPVPALEQLGPTGQTVFVWIHTVVKEDALDLYGFLSARDRELFQLLLGVPNVGPKLAILLMSALSPAELSRAVSQGDLAALTRVKGIGKKTAEALLFHLKDKALALAAAASGELAAPLVIERKVSPSDELVSALLALGYKPAQAEGAAARARDRIPDGQLDPLVREALKILRQG